MRTHGELTNDGCGRWCEPCGQEHGSLYPCRHYPRWIANDIEAQTVRWRQRLREKIATGDRSPGPVTASTFAGVYVPELRLGTAS